MEIKPIILCGGAGTRLWPLSRESLPKQFVPLIQGQNLLRLTISRVSSLLPPIFITNEDHRYLVQDELDHFDCIERGLILLEPDGRNTAAAIASVIQMPSISKNDILLFLPSDHFIPDIDAFLMTIQSGISASKSGFIVTFGIQPNFPSTAYGYIEKGTIIGDGASTQSSISAYLANAFIEKPALEKAQQMLLSGSYLWNSGILMCEVSTLISAFAQHAPDIFESCKAAMQSPEIDGNFIRPNKPLFLGCRSESIDYAVMEHFKKLAVIPFNGMWSDVGSWNAVANLTKPDSSGNRVIGQGVVLQAKNTYINAGHRPVVALGTDDLVIIDSLDAVLVSSVDKLEEVKNVVMQLKKNGIKEASLHRRVFRPWGWYDLIDKGERFQVKRIEVKPGASLSLQKHQYRAEHWVVVAGVAKVTNGDNVFLLEENQSTYIPIGAKHRLENIGHKQLEIIEIQSGSYLGEDDIVRFEDVYNRI